MKSKKEAWEVIIFPPFVMKDKECLSPFSFQLVYRHKYKIEEFT